MRWSRAFIATVAGACAIVAAAADLAAQTHPALRDAKLPPLVPLSLFAGADEDSRSGFRLSPDGRYLAWSERVGGRRQIHVRPTAGGDALVVRTSVPVSQFAWLPDSRRLAYALDSGGNENTQIWTVDAQSPSAPPRNLTPWPGTRSGLLSFPRDGDDFFIYSNTRDRRVFDVYRVPPGPDATPVMHELNTGTVDRWFFDRAGRLAARTTRAGTDGRRVFERCPGGSATCARAFDLDWDEQLTVLDIAAGENEVWALSNRGRDKTALVRLGLADGAEKVVLADPAVDVGGVVYDQIRRAPLLAFSWPGHQTVHAPGGEAAADLAALRGGPQDVLAVLSHDRAMRWFVVSLQSAGSATRTLLFDREARQRTLLHAGAFDAYRESISPVRPVEYRARDGLPIRGYLTLPAGAPARGLPAVMLVHGGPWARDTGTLGAWPQMLANRGYAVLQVNYRGSSGYGRAFMASGIGELGAKTQDDIDDGARWLVEQGIADRGKIAIIGASYGGFSTFVGMTRTPTLYAAGVASVGITDLPAFIDLVPPYWDRSRWNRFLGPSNTPEGRAALWARSPLAHVDKLERPLLIMHGANDPRVRRDQSERFFGAARALGKPVEFHLFENEGHGLSRPENRMVAFGRTELFLARHLGGRATPAPRPATEAAGATK
ncbi:MAG: S9 family peptidase [Rhodospirillales bacterium]|nr:MAG: S9 family peptidase [Rhodospirillales bacterium]